MQIDLTALFTAIITVIIALISKYVIPFLKAKLANVKKEDLVFWVEIAVKAAEQLAKNGTIQKAGRKEYVKEFLIKKGFSLDTAEVDNLIESFVNDLPSQVVSDNTNAETNAIVQAAAEMVVSANEKEKAISDAEVDKAKAEAQKAKAEADKAKAEATKAKEEVKKK